MILTERDWSDHVKKLESTLNKLKVKGLKCNIEKYFFGKIEIGNLGIFGTRNGVKPIDIKIEAI